MLYMLYKAVTSSILQGDNQLHLFPIAETQIELISLYPDSFISESFHVLKNSELKNIQNLLDLVDIRLNPESINSSVYRQVPCERFIGCSDTLLIYEMLYVMHELLKRINN